MWYHMHQFAFAHKAKLITGNFLAVASFLDPLAKKDSIVDTISAMEFYFLYEKRLIFALLPLISVILRAFFLL